MGRPRKTPAQKLATLPKRYRAGLFGSDLMDWNTSAGLAYATEVLTLAQDLGGWDSLSYQRRAIVENTAYQRLKTREFQLADLQGKPLPYDRGTYTNKANVMLGHLKALGLDRQATLVRSLREHLDAKAAEEAPP
jgi:hypothetical protein